MAQDYTQYRTRKTKWDDRDLVSVTSYKGAGKGDAGGTHSAETTTLTNLRTGIFLGSSLQDGNISKVYTSVVKLTKSDIQNSFTFSPQCTDFETYAIQAFGENADPKVEENPITWSAVPLSITLVVTGNTAFTSSGGNFLLQWREDTNYEIGKITRDIVQTDLFEAGEKMIWNVHLSSITIGSEYSALYNEQKIVNKSELRLKANSFLSGGASADVEMTVVTRFLLLNLDTLVP